jgi:hypothetical protein
MTVVQIGDITTGKMLDQLPYMTPLLLVRKTETQITVMPCSLLF